MYDLYPKDYVHFEGRKFRPTRFFDHRLMRHCWPMFEEVKKRREENIRRDDCVRRRQKEKYLKAVTKNLERSYEAYDGFRP